MMKLITLFTCPQPFFAGGEGPLLRLALMARLRTIAENEIRSHSHHYKNICLYYARGRPNYLQSEMEFKPSWNHRFGEIPSLRLLDVS
jgi:hypothetical protein